MSNLIKTVLFEMTVQLKHALVEIHLKSVLFLFCCFLIPFSVHAGSIGFSVSFTSDAILISNTGSEPAYRLSAWTLNSTSKWSPVQFIVGNSAYLPPGGKLSGKQLGPSVTNRLGRAAPLLLILHDQAGSKIVQLAWRRPPETRHQTIPTRRNGQKLVIKADTAIEQKIVSTFAFVVPYDGVTRLSNPLPATEATPPSPIEHTWATGNSMVLDTGAAQGGAWLVHETAAGYLHVQIVPEGVVRGQEQVPAWLIWTRQYLLALAAILAGLGSAVMIMGVAHSAHRGGALVAKSGLP